MKACSLACGIPAKDVHIQRTKGRKPFLSNPHGPTSKLWPNFNYSVSHDGSFVSLVADPLRLVGADVCSCQNRLLARSQSGSLASTSYYSVEHVSQFLRKLERQFSTDEWALITAACPGTLAADTPVSMHTSVPPACVTAQMELFSVLWSLKEAYVKARGDGIAFDLS